MQDDSVVDLKKRIDEDSRGELDNVLREGARQMLQAAAEAEVSDSFERKRRIA